MAWSGVLSISSIGSALCGAGSPRSAPALDSPSRELIAARLTIVPQCLIGIEAGMPTHYVARELIALGHDVKQVPPAYARPFRQGHKNDFRRAGDRGSAAAIAKAESRRPETALCWSFEVRRATVDCSFRGKWRRVLRRRRGKAKLPAGYQWSFASLETRTPSRSRSCNTAFGACVYLQAR